MKHLDGATLILPCQINQRDFALSMFSFWMEQKDQKEFSDETSLISSLFNHEGHIEGGKSVLEFL